MHWNLTDIGTYYNNSSGKIKLSCDMDFHENNGSQTEQVISSVVGDADSSQVMRSIELLTSCSLKLNKIKSLIVEIRAQLKLKPLPQQKMTTSLKWSHLLSKYQDLNQMSKIKIENKNDYSLS